MDLDPIADSDCIAFDWGPNSCRDKGRKVRQITDITFAPAQGFPKHQSKAPCPSPFHPYLILITIYTTKSYIFVSY